MRLSWTGSSLPTRFISTLLNMRAVASSSATRVSWRSWWRIVAIAASGLVATATAGTTVLLDFEGVGDNQPVLNYYGGGSGGPAQNYGIVFGSNAYSVVDGDVGGGPYNLTNEPSPSTVLFMPAFGGESQAFLTVLGGFVGLSFQYDSLSALNVTLYEGPDRTGTVLGTFGFPAAGTCPQGFCAWKRFTVPPFPGVARSAGFDLGVAYLFIDDMVVELAPPPTNVPTKRPTKSPASGACVRRGMKGTTNRCMKKKKKKPKKVAS
jgi:hypothetical protein